MVTPSGTRQKRPGSHLEPTADGLGPGLGQVVLQEVLLRRAGGLGNERPILAPQEPFQGPPVLDAAVGWAGGLGDEQDASRMDGVVWAEGFDAEEPSEVLCSVAVLARIRQLYRIEDACREMSADERRFRSLPIGSRPTAVVLPIPRVECRACGAVRQVMVPFADPRREVPPPSVVERRPLGESCGLAVGDPRADPGLRASQEFGTAQAYTGRRDRSSAFRLHSSGGS